MLPDEVREAVAVMDRCNEVPGAWNAVRDHLLAREADVERLQNIADGNAELYQHELLRTERAEALLRECRDVFEPEPYKGSYQAVALIARITAHLSENSRG